ncbi:MAG: substrate-binding domain-containing protein [Anaerolineae bacterium]|nr:substrate-binding domain-containing protein [Anaerolineae bacterium]
MGRQTRTREKSAAKRRKATQRPTIGLLVGEVTSWWGQSLLEGVTDAAEMLDVNLCCFVDGVRPEKDSGGSNGLYDLLNPDLLDGLVVSGNIGYAVSPESFHAFIDDLKTAFPTVGVIMTHEGIPSVLVDGFSGMYAAIKHLIEIHGCRRLAFIRGPVGNVDADERYRAYTTALEEYGIPFDPELVAISNFSAGRPAVEALWPRMMAISREEQDTTPWALVSANDDMAVQAMLALRDFGARVPEDVVVVGFDDTITAQNLDVPLTTVRQPTYAMGQRAMQMVLQLVHGESTPDKVMVPAEMVVRRSCGCLPEAVLQIPVEMTPVATEKSIPAFTGISASLWEAFIAGVRDPSSNDFLLLLDQTLRQARYEEAGLGEWQPLLTEMRRHALVHLDESDARHRAENLLQQARLLVGDAERRYETYLRQRFQQQETLLGQIDNTLSTTLHLQELAPALNGLFPSIGVECCFASLYQGADSLAENARLLFDYDTLRSGDASVVELYPDEGPLFPSRRLVPRDIFVAERQRTIIVMSLVLQARQLGFAVMWAGQHWRLYVRLRQRLSDVIFRALLAREQERAQREAEEAERRAEEALRDVLVAQRRYVHGAWEERVEAVSGYVYSDELRGVSNTAWLPQMSEAVQRGDVVLTQDVEGGQTLTVPVMLYGEEVVGVLGFKTTEAAPWTEDHLTLVRTIATETALALETQRLFSDVQRRASRLLAAAEISRVTTSILTLDELLPQAVNLIRERFDLYYAGIFLVDESQRWAILRAGTGEAGRLMLERNHRLEVGGNSMIGACAASGEARVTIDTHTEAVHRSNPLLPDTRSELALPLFSRGRVIGAMTIQDTRPGAFTQEDITTLQTMADQLANAIENARLLRRMEQNMHELELATGQLTQESWRSFLENYRHAFGYRYRLVDIEPATYLSPEAQAALRQQETITTTVVPARVVQIDQETVRAQGALSVPIRVRNEVLGVLNLRFDDAEVPTEAIELVEQVAARLGAALESARLLEESRYTATREQIAAQVTSGMRERLDIEVVLRNAARELRDALDLSRVSVRLAPRFASTDAPGNNGAPVSLSGGKA